MTSTPPTAPIRRAGFTLVELLIVIAIIATLIAITIPAIVRARESANRATCMNNLHDLAIACWHHQQQVGYYPTAGTSDNCLPTYSAPGTNQAGQPVTGWQQDAGWGFQVLPFISAENVWTGGSTDNMGNAVTTQIQQVKGALGTPLKDFFCPSRRTPSTRSITFASTFPANSLSFPTTPFVYASLRGAAVNVMPTDYAGCNGTGYTGTTPNQDGVILSQGIGGTLARNTVKSTDISDGPQYTLMLGEKAANPLKSATLTNEDDNSYACGFNSTNLNAIRFASQTLLPVHDFQVTGPTGGAFGSAHSTTWNAAMADGSVQSLSYNISPTVFQALGTIKGRENIADQDLNP